MSKSSFPNTTKPGLLGETSNSRAGAIEIKDETEAS